MEEFAAARHSSNASLRRAVREGDIAAQLQLGKRLLVDQENEFSPEEGAALIASAAHGGNAEAAAIAAVIIGANAVGPAQWTMALEYLQQAAEGGWKAAQQQLAFLSPTEDLRELARSQSVPPDIWGRLRRSIDLNGWFRPPAPKIISEAPYIAEIEAFLAKDYCDWLIHRTRDRMRRAQVFDRRTAQGEVAESRTNSAYEFDPVTSDLVLMLICARIAVATGSHPRALEHSNVLHYAEGQEFARHYDFLDPQTPAFERELSTRGQRVASFLVYLNEDFDGAETEFPQLARRFRRETGGALFFKNVDSAGQPDRATLHAGLAPRRGEKWLLSQWIRGEPQRHR